MNSIPPVVRPTRSGGCGSIVMQSRASGSTRRSPSNPDWSCVGSETGSVSWKRHRARRPERTLMPWWMRRRKRFRQAVTAWCAVSAMWWTSSTGSMPHPPSPTLNWNRKSSTATPSTARSSKTLLWSSKGISSLSKRRPATSRTAWSSQAALPKARSGARF